MEAVIWVGVIALIVIATMIANARTGGGGTRRAHVPTNGTLVG